MGGCALRSWHRACSSEKSLMALGALKTVAVSHTIAPPLFVSWFPYVSPPSFSTSFRVVWLLSATRGASAVRACSMSSIALQSRSWKSRCAGSFGDSVLLGLWYFVGTARPVTRGAEKWLSVYVGGSLMFPVFLGSPSEKELCYGLFRDEQGRRRGLFSGPPASTTVLCPRLQLCGVPNSGEP